MSIRVLSSAWKTKCSSHSQKLVLLNLADHANDCGVCWPAIWRIAQQCGMSRVTVIAQIKKLEADGMLAITRTKGGWRNPNRYRLIIEELKALNSFAVVRTAQPIKNNGSAALNPTRVQMETNLSSAALTNLSSAALNSNRQEPSIEPPTREGGSLLPAQGGGAFNSKATFWENKARLELVEQGIREIKDRASVCAMETIIEPRDMERYRSLLKQRRHLISTLNV